MTTRICHKCGKSYDNIVEFCPYCHAVNRTYHNPSETGAQKINASRVIKLICVGGIGLFLLVMLCGALSLCFYHPSSLSGSSFVGNTQVTLDTQQQAPSSSSAAYAQAVKTSAIPQTTVAVSSTSPTLQSANDDQNYIDAYKSSLQELVPIGTAINTKLGSYDFSTTKTLSMKWSTRSQYWYNEVAPLSVSSNYQESKDAFLLYLSEVKAEGDGLAEAMQLFQDGKGPAFTSKLNEVKQHTNLAANYIDQAADSLPTSQSVNDNQKIVYRQTVAVQRTLQRANDDQKFIDAYKSSGQELAPIITAINTELGSYHYSTVKALGTKLSTRTQFWYNEISPMQVSSNLQEGEDAYLQALPEVKAYGDALADAMQFFQDGNGPAFTSKLNEANQHLKKATIYLNLAAAELPA